MLKDVRADDQVKHLVELRQTSLDGLG